jgi:hypothetical protein
METATQFVAVRKLEWCERNLQPGDALGCSEIWRDHKPTGKFLDGVCAFDARTDVLNAFRAAKAWKTEWHPTAPRMFAVLGGEVVDSQADDRHVERCEVVVKNPIVISIYKFENGSFQLVRGVEID